MRFDQVAASVAIAFPRAARRIEARFFAGVGRKTQAPRPRPPFKGGVEIHKFLVFGRSADASRRVRISGILAPPARLVAVFSSQISRPFKRFKLLEFERIRRFSAVRSAALRSFIRRFPRPPLARKLAMLALKIFKNILLAVGRF